MTAFERAAVLAPVLNLEGVAQALRSVDWDEPVAHEQLLSVLGSSGGGCSRCPRTTPPPTPHPKSSSAATSSGRSPPKGEAAVTGVLAALDSLRHTVSLQPAVLDAIGDALVEIASLLDGPATPEADASVHLRLAETESHLAGLVASVRQFNGQLQRLVHSSGEEQDTELFLEVKRRTVSYLEEFVDGVDRPRRRIELAVRALQDRTASLFGGSESGSCPTRCRARCSCSRRATNHRSRGSPRPTPWSPELASTMRSTGAAVHEEAIRDDLFAGILGR